MSQQRAAPWRENGTELFLVWKQTINVYTIENDSSRFTFDSVIQYWSENKIFKEFLNIDVPFKSQRNLKNSGSFIVK